VPSTMLPGRKVPVEIEPRWTARRRERIGVCLVVRRRDVSQEPRFCVW